MQTALRPGLPGGNVTVPRLPSRPGLPPQAPALHGENYYFLQHDLKKHRTGHVILTRGRQARRFNIVQAYPRPSFTNWHIWEKPSGKRQLSYEKKLWRIEQLSLSFVSKIDMEDRSPFVLAVANIIRVKDNSQNPNWTKGSEGINLQKKHITIPRWSTQLVEPIKFEFYPRLLKSIEWPKKYDDLLEQAEGKR